MTGGQPFEEVAHFSMLVGGKQPRRQMGVQVFGPLVLCRSKIIRGGQMAHDEAREIHQRKQCTNQAHGKNNGHFEGGKCGSGPEAAQQDIEAE